MGYLLVAAAAGMDCLRVGGSLGKLLSMMCALEIIVLAFKPDGFRAFPKMRVINFWEDQIEQLTNF